MLVCYVLYSLFDAFGLTDMAGACDANTGGGCDEWGGTRNHTYDSFSAQGTQLYTGDLHLDRLGGGLPYTYTQTCIHLSSTLVYIRETHYLWAVGNLANSKN